ncbi:diguanylate cyclase [Paenibacillus sp. NPDC058071]|uniref:sensor domain-containing diguanylate cyclase n=1 Tax=Paenibacillus sp. NPDC058071 TaxID=3346326 RepID=UPI0036DA2286
MIKVLKPTKGFRLFTIISLVVLLSVLIAILINIIVGYQTEKSSLTTNTIELNVITAGDLSKTTYSLIRSMKDSIRVTADYLADSELSDASVLTQLDFFMNTNHYFNSIAVINAQGTVVSTSPNNLGIIGAKLTSKAAKESLETRKPYISEPYVALTQRLLVMVSHPIFDSNGNYKGFVAGTIYLHQPNIFQDILGVQTKNNSGTYYYVVDSNGTIIFHPEKKRIADNVQNNPVVAKLMNGQAGHQRVINSEGKSFLAGFSPVPEIGWGIVSQTPEAYVISTSRNMITQMAVYSTPFLILLLTLTLWLSRTLVEPLNRLARDAYRLSMGDSTAMKFSNKVYWNYEANQLMSTVALAFSKLQKQTETLTQEAHTDSLTGLSNRRMMDEIMNAWHKQHLPFSIIVLDLDHFKSVNDEFGHQMGDEMLKLLADTMLSVKQDKDYCCRFGGEEFTLLLPLDSEQQAFRVAETLRRKMETVPTPMGRPVTVSLGIASYPKTSNDLQTLFKCADEALYRAKHEGRNRTVLYSEMEDVADKGIVG